MRVRTRTQELHLHCSWMSYAQIQELRLGWTNTLVASFDWSTNGVLCTIVHCRLIKVRILFCCNHIMRHKQKCRLYRFQNWVFLIISENIRWFDRKSLIVSEINVWYLIWVSLIVSKNIDWYSILANSILIFYWYPTTEVSLILIRVSVSKVSGITIRYQYHAHP